MITNVDCQKELCVVLMYRVAMMIRMPARIDPVGMSWLTTEERNTATVLVATAITTELIQEA
jgi:hypothetical protein